MPGKWPSFSTWGLVQFPSPWFSWVKGEVGHTHISIASKATAIFSTPGQACVTGALSGLLGLVIWDQQFPPPSHPGKQFTSCSESPFSTPGQDFQARAPSFEPELCNYHWGSLCPLFSSHPVPGAAGGWGARQVCITGWRIMRETETVSRSLC